MENINIKEILSHFKSGKFEIAEKETANLIKKYPNNFFLFNLFGAILAGQKKLDEAIFYYEKSIKISPEYADAYNNLASTLAEQKKYDKAIKYFRKAIELKPNLVESYYNLGNALSETKQYNESIKNYIKAIKIKPDYTKAHSNLGNVLKVINNFQDAISCYKKAIQIDENFLDAYKNLAFIYCDIGQLEEAKKYFQKLLKLKPNNVLYKINTALLLSPIYKSLEEINLSRNKFIDSLNELKKYKYLSNHPAKDIEFNFYYHVYDNKDDLKISKKLAELFRNSIPNINYIAKNIITKKIKKKIKVGFISEHFTDHTVGKLFKGFINNINKQKFEILVFHTNNTKKGLIKNEIDKSANKVVILVDAIKKQQKQIEDENLDIIFYPDIGMSPATYFLAFARLAAVQIVSWGHPITTGIQTLDYFLSSSLFETPGAKERYTEKLICFDQFPLYYEPPKNINLKKNRKDFHLPENANLYGCPQSLFKIHPNFDLILEKILNKDPNGFIVFIGGEGKYKFWIETLKERWSKISSIFKSKVLFIDRLNLSDFISLCDCVDVLLDPIYFGGGNTFLESMLVGTPTVTMPSKHLKSNITAAAYKQMKISKPPIVKNSEEYINLAIKLAKDKKNNKILREKSKKAADKYLFNNSKVLKSFEKFLDEAYRMAQKGKKLKNGYVFKS